MGSKVNTALINGSYRSGMDHHRMDTGMREALEMVMRQLVNDVSVYEGDFYTVCASFRQLHMEGGKRVSTSPCCKSGCGPR